MRGVQQKKGTATLTGDMSVFWNMSFGSARKLLNSGYMKHPSQSFPAGGWFTSILAA